MRYDHSLAKNQDRLVWNRLFARARARVLVFLLVNEFVISRLALQELLLLVEALSLLMRSLICFDRRRWL